MRARRIALGSSVVAMVLAWLAPAYAQMPPAAPASAPPATAAPQGGAASSARPPSPEGSGPVPVPPIEPVSRPYSVSECIDLALSRSPEVRGAVAEQDGAESSRTGARGRMLPLLRADGYAYQYTTPFEIPFAIPGAPGPAPVFRVRDAFIWGGTVSLVQPITDLWSLYEEYRFKDLGIDVAAIRSEVTRRESALRVVERYYRLVEAERLASVADASVQQLAAQLRLAHSLHDNGVVGQNDVLRAELALASARQRQIQQHGQVVIGRSSLAAAMGMPTSTPVEARPFTGDPPAMPARGIDDAERRALASRVELAEVAKRIEQAEHGVQAAWGKMLPQVRAVASYQHREGSEFDEVNSAYVGGVLSWNAWDWGATPSAIGEAKARLRQAAAGRDALKNRIGLDARMAFGRLMVATQALQVARAALASAEENYRLATKRYEAAAATSFDVVDAEGVLTQARAQAETALYDYLVSHAVLRHAMGDPIPTFAPEGKP